MLDPELYLKSAGLTRSHFGGQELILHEICALLGSYPTVWLPFPKACVTLADTLKEQGHNLALGRRIRKDTDIDAVYFGTPTIVGGKQLFPGTARDIKDKLTERTVVRSLVKRATMMGAKRIVTGLGSGDISVRERQADMKGAQVVVEKRFDEFTDWVIVRDL